jgi:hypothetical protein
MPKVNVGAEASVKQQFPHPRKHGERFTRRDIPRLAEQLATLAGSQTFWCAFTGRGSLRDDTQENKLARAVAAFALNYRQAIKANHQTCKYLKGRCGALFQK